MSRPPELDEIERIALDTVASLPDPFRGPAARVLIRVTDFCPPDLLHPGEDGWEITGLYTGIPMTEKSFSDWPEEPDTVWLFRRPILAELKDRGNVTLEELVAHVTIHEFAHHFGWSDDDIAAIDRWWE